MPQEANSDSTFTTPSKSLRGGLKGLNCQEGLFAEEVINDDELAQRKAEEAASRRYQAAEWLRQMDQGASGVLPKEPTEEEFCLALRNGLILCNVLNKVNPGAVSKVVENPIVTVQSTEGAAQSAIQYFENMRNFLVAVGDMKLLTFEASDLEKGGSSVKVVDCILCLKGYHEWKQAGGIGVWRYGGTVKITSLPKGSPSSLIASENADEPLDDPDLFHNKKLEEFLLFSTKMSHEESNTTKALTYLFDHFGLGLLRAFLMEWNGIEDFSLNAMLIDAVIGKVVKDFRGLIVSHGNQLMLLLKEILKGNAGSATNADFLDAISQYLAQRTHGISSASKFCICGGKPREVSLGDNHNSSHAKRLDLQQKQLEELKLISQETKAEVEEVNLNWEDELKRLEHHIKSLEVTSSSYHKVLEENRLLYNQVQDLKGTIRVYCRVRPFLPGQSDGQSTVDYIDENGNIMIINPFKQGKDARRIFSFNKVFGANATQQQVFVDTQPLIRSILDGYNVCIFAYGQTGSGKTYTMSGPDLTTQETWGVNYRALNDLFRISKSRMDIIEYVVGVQMIEIYNEQVRDLLVIDGSNRRLEIRNNSQLNGLNVPDASLIQVRCTQDVLDLMRIGQRNRAVGATALNERSSRSHSVLTVHVQGKELASGSILRGCLHLVDLAGSERVDKSEAVGERLKEAQHINKSLSALGDVISALAQKSTHIPYRNSKLTQVLQDSLGGQAKTLMFVHINPEVNAIGETISTLKFAERVASIELGAARSNKETGEIRELKEEISNLKLALERKEAELQKQKLGNSRIGMESQKVITVSPLSVSRYGTSVSVKPESSQLSTDDSRSIEARSCSSGKQRRSHFSSRFTDKDQIPKMHFIEENFINSVKQRSPSPPVRRSISTDRGALARSRLKLDSCDNSPMVKPHLPARVALNKSVATIPGLQANDNLKGCRGPLELEKQDNVSDVFYSLQNLNSRKVHPEHEEEQFKQALNIRKGGIRKNKMESKSKIKHQLPTLLLDAEVKMEETRKNDFSETENENALIGSPIYGSLRMKKHRQNFARSSQNLEPRGSVQAVDQPLIGKNEYKLPCSIRCGKDGINISMLDSRRIRSSSHGKSMI
ncbi:PREDICTED: kinesin-like protein KIN-14F [Nelumbo nucifera]|uniref:Kinesin-like protein KIN-14F n=2 Tax=Nelumbo nucifera TaxID=4432 RepID=A0A1U7ZWH2_NELNU|nr:PREDICTED: kinesin-like protein KIN-14F [Nelumbo nucifera]XP_019052753.1 PREDICTED: kinesin-like protein KIN-14F [Nelumbo nucifera]XP_019052754.1 PREDICTED: kinesin-like protein KIN-14F [Nelumbo nucifera]DAD23721.1 TPA_asm: hypothetical protein HUJ06_025184 [Nelumbo nucifera]